MQRFLISLFFFFLLPGCGNTVSEVDPEWTIMVYMAGDNDLSSALENDLAEIELAGSSKKVRVLIQLDLSGPGTKRMEIRGGARVVEEIGEQNMADAETLTGFINWAMGKVPDSDRYALIISSHGDGYGKGEREKIIQDDADGGGCCLSNRLVRKAIEDTGVHFDLIGFDASQMGQVETAYEFANMTDVLVFSQETGQKNGWEYTSIVRALNNSPGMSADDLSGVVVDSYKKFYEEIFYIKNPTFEQNLTISAIRMGDGIGALADGIDALAGEMLDLLNSETGGFLVEEIEQVRKDTQELNRFTRPFVFVDLFDLLEKFNEREGLPLGVREKAMDLISMRENVVISEYHGAACGRCGGLSIAFFRLPESVTFATYDPDYNDLSGPEFTADTKWDNFLVSYYQAAGLEL